MTTDPRQSRLDKLSSTIQTLQARRQALLHKRSLAIARLVQKSGASLLPDDILSRLLQRASGLYAESTDHPALRAFLDQEPKAVSRKTQENPS